MILTYDIKGRILVLPIVGQGPGNLTLENPVFTYKFNYELATKANNSYINMIDPLLTYTTSKMNFHLENLFNGDERLGKYSFVYYRQLNTHTHITTSIIIFIF